tara:strand:- start:119 stop:727 length:609 start_codon:yes stop_codon:yes gene_type:complete
MSIRAELKFKNGVFMSALERVGYKSVAEYGRETGISYSTLIPYANLYSVPKDPKVRKKMIETLFEDEYTLFVQFEEVIDAKKKMPKLTRSVPIDQFVELGSTELLKLESDDIVDEYIDDESLKEDIKDSMSTLKDRERQVLKMYFGLEGEKPLNLSEIGKIFKLKKERIRQIKEKAIRRLRHKSRSTNLKKYPASYVMMEDR